MLLASVQQSPFLAHITSHQQPPGALSPQCPAQESALGVGLVGGRSGLEVPPPGQKVDGAQTEVPLLVLTQQPEGQLSFALQSCPQRMPRLG
jgi:hypothetical protein